MKPSFKFKQFGVMDDRCSMKVGTDAVLLGCWVSTSKAHYILDIGTGSGVIALMMAQRSDADIDAIDIDRASMDQASENIMASKWHDRIKISHISLQDFIKVQKKKYDLIVTNPPFFSNSLKSPKENRNIARHNDKLSFDELIFGVKRLLEKDGSFCLILPENESRVFKEKAIINGLFPLRSLHIYPKKNKAVNRVLTEFCFMRPSSFNRERMIIRNDDGTFTPEYIYLTKDFYLDF